MIGVILAKKIVRSAFKSLSQHDLESLMGYWEDDSKLVYPCPLGSGFDDPVYEVEGKESIEAWYKKFIDNWQVTSFTIKNLTVKRHCPFAFGTNTALVEYDLKVVTKTGAKESDTSGVAAIDIKRGRFSEVRFYECLKDPIWQVVS